MNEAGRTYQAIGRDLDAALIGHEQFVDFMREGRTPQQIMEGVAVHVQTMHVAGPYLQEALQAYLIENCGPIVDWAREWLASRADELRAELQGETRAASFREHKEAATGGEAAPPQPGSGTDPAKGRSTARKGASSS